MEIWYEKPAGKWEEALPIGNGRLGAMVSGKTDSEIIWLNEDSIWSGKPLNRINPDAKKYLGKIRTLLRKGKIGEAERLSLMALSGTPNSERSYETAGELFINFDNAGKTTSYRRGLDLDSGIAYSEYEAAGTVYKREMLSSYKDQVMALHMTAEGKEKLGFSMRLGRCHNNTDEVWAQGNRLGFYCDGGEGISFAVVSQIETDGSVERIGEHLVIEGAYEATIYLAIETSFRNEDYKTAAAERLEKAAAKGWKDIRKDHLEDFESFMKRVRLELGEEKDIPTDKRLAALRKGKSDPSLFALYFQYGRYLLLSSSRGESLPANLQGIWNNSLTPPWDSKFTININTEMNYWMAETGNLSECHLPYFEFLKRVCENGRKTALEMYGCRGSVAHHNSDIYADTAPQDHYIPASFWVMGEAWLSTHIWQHYLYTEDKEFLSEYFEVLQASVDFFKDFLIEGEDGCLVTSPSVSPENTYIMKDGTRGCMCEGPAMDVEILLELFDGYEGACRALGKDESLIEEVQKIRDRLPKLGIGKHGQLMEWAKDYDEQEPGHRHISHLYGVYPGHCISAKKTPELMKASEVTLKRRLSHGGGHTGWSRAWITCLWTQFGNGEKVYENLKALLCEGTFDNLMDNHPYGPGAVFQIDGNFGTAAAMIEMLVSWAEGELKLLPALPKEFGTGFVDGIRLPGNKTLRMRWDKGKVTECEVF
ncbi:glycoside hydrolase family 95 protein [Butyrivibrio sp. MC2021]|uniref:glycoside hydrolase family 95 protein n=1 Tax=Butyrivibrio sp. MC2021 TaxID=1408306 RepID=UPI000686A724|nr:glycoside hydrolase family 95 protein [Butyrivibrio sp. MC2021]